MISNEREVHRGFTLIELLVVISVIGLVSSIIMAGVASARYRAIDTATAENLRQLKLAMDLYKDAKGYYPGQGLSGLGGGYTTCSYYGYGGSACFEALENELKPYLPSLDFLSKSFDTDFGIFYTYDLYSLFGGPEGIPTYTCEDKNYTSYFFLFNSYDKNYRKIKLNLPLNNTNIVEGSEHYCFGE